jgi:hypothetical protein
MSSSDELSDEEIMQAIMTKASVPLWPHTGRVLNIRRGATYDAGKDGRIPTLGVSRKQDVSTAWIRQKLGIQK